MDGVATPLALDRRGNRLPPGFPKLSESRAVKHASAFFDRNHALISEIECRIAHESGRPRRLPVRAVLVAGMAVAMLDRRVLTTNIAALLAGLGKGTQIALGARWLKADGREHVATHRQVDHLLDAIAVAFKPESTDG